MQSFDYDVFFSHSSKDRGEVELLCLYLTEHQFKVWVSYPEIEPADDWLTEIARGLNTSAVLLVFWTKSASETTWVKNEIVEMQKQNKPILILLRDDTPLPFYLNNVHYLDFRGTNHTPYMTLVSRLQALLETANENHLALQSDQPWKSIRRVSPRIQFLADEQYIDEKADDFALNNWTKKIYVDKTHSLDQRFVTFVSVPFPSELSVDLETLHEIVYSKPQKLGELRFGHLEPGQPWRWFDLSEIRNIRETKNELILFDNKSQGYRAEAIYKYMRFTNSGAVEFALGFPAVYPKAVFNFSVILGCAWKFINFAAYLYDQLNYKGIFQFLVNMRETRTTILANFAESTLDPNAYNSAKEEYLKTHYAAMDRHLQFAFEIDGSSILARSELSRDVIVRIARDLGRSFNHTREELLSMQKIDSFSWRERFFDYHVGV